MITRKKQLPLLNFIYTSKIHLRPEFAHILYYFGEDQAYIKLHNLKLVNLAMIPSFVMNYKVLDITFEGIYY